MGGTTSNCCLSALLSYLRSPSQYQNDDYIIVMFVTTTRLSIGYAFEYCVRCMYVHTLPVT